MIADLKQIELVIVKKTTVSSVKGLIYRCRKSGQDFSYKLANFA